MSPSLFQGLNKKYNDELNEMTKGLKLEVSLLKQSHDARSSRSSVQQLKQEMCMEYSSTLKVRELWLFKIKNHRVKWEQIFYTCASVGFLLHIFFYLSPSFHKISFTESHMNSFVLR
jgi:hypothetical protein